MQKIGKRILSFVLTISMIWSMMPSQVVFGEPDEPDYHYMIFLNGYAWDKSLTVSYSFDGSSFHTILENDEQNGIGQIFSDPQGNNGGIEFDIQSLVEPESDSGENPNNLVLKIEINESSQKIMAVADFNWDEDASTYIKDAGKTFKYAMKDKGQKNYINLAFAYPNEGLKGIEGEVKNYLFAYDTVDANNLAAELYDRFIEVPMFERFGFNKLPGDDGYDDDDRTRNIDELASRITVPSSVSSTVTVKLADGSTASRNVYNCSVAWGTDRDTGSSIESVIKVIDLNSSNEFIVSTDWDSSTGFGANGSFYARNATTDHKKFYASDGGDSYSITVPSYGKIVAGGSNGRMTELNTDGMYSFQYDVEGSIHAIVRVLKQNESYVAIVRGGSDKFDGLGNNGTPTDDIWNTGTGKNATVYIGDQFITLEPLDNTVAGLSANTTISDVTLKDTSMSEGVSIDASNKNSIKISFASNFYDAVPITITYTGGTKKDLTINRIGLVIQYRYLDDSNHTEIYYDCKNVRCGLDYGYWNKNGNEDPSRWSANEQVLIYATYYHPSTDKTAGDSANLTLCVNYDSGETEMIAHTDSAHGFNGYNTLGGVKTTSFIIGFAPAKRLVGYDWVDIISQTYAKGGFSATVLNAGYDNEDSFGGTQVGSGAGVHWDGRINWY